MKKTIRIVWISVLSGLAFLAACCGSRGLSRAERKKLVKERESIEKTLAEMPVPDSGRVVNYYKLQEERYGLMNKLDSINFRLGEDIDLAKNVRRRELLLRLDSLDYAQYIFDNTVVYGPPEGMDESYYARRAFEQSEINKGIQETKKELELLDQLEMERNLKNNK